MKRFACLTIVLLITTGVVPIRAQDTPLQNLLKARNDTAKVNRLIQYADKLTDTDPQKAPALLKHIVRLSHQLHYPDGTGAALYLLGYVDISNGKYLQAMRYYRHATAYYRQTNNLRKIAKCQTSIGNVYGYLGKTDSCIMEYISAIKVMEDNHFRPELSRAYLNQGILVAFVILVMLIGLLIMAQSIVTFGQKTVYFPQKHYIIYVLALL